MKGAQIVVEILKEQGIDTLFGYPGGMILPLYDALYDEKNINQILVTHEQNAAHAADGYAGNGKGGSVYCNLRAWSHQSGNWYCHCIYGFNSPCGYYWPGGYQSFRY